MTLSNLMLTILEQAKEPLHCLHGAGYFTGEEWIQLDLIMNKKYLWTLGPQNCSRPSSRAPYNVNKLTRNLQAQVKLHSPDSDGDKVCSSTEEVSDGTSTEPLSDDVEIGAVPTDTTWELSPAMASPNPLKTIPNELNETGKKLSLERPASGYTLSQHEVAKTLKANFVNRSMRENHVDRHQESQYCRIKSNPKSSRHKSVASWASEVCNTRLQKPGIHPTIKPPVIKPNTNYPQTSAPAMTTATALTASNCDDVNAYETSNAAEWDHSSPIYQKRQSKKDLDILLQDNFEQFSDNTNQGSQSNNLSRSVTKASPARSEMLHVRRTTASAQPLRTQEVKESKNRIYEKLTPQFPKTQICWYWAVSDTGCRYRADECINLHVRPERGAPPNYSLKDGRPTCGTLADAVPQRVPPGKRPRSCWFWAIKGACDKEDACEYVHGWVSGGLASRPKNFEFGTKMRNKMGLGEKQYYSMENSTKHVLDLDEKDIDDQGPSQATSIDRGFVPKRIHTSKWC